MAAIRPADRPGAAAIIERCDQRVVLAFAPRHPDGMNRWKVKHVEAHFDDVREPRLAIGESRRGTSIAGGAREHFVPAAESGPRWIDDQPECRLEGGGEAAISVTRSDLCQLRIERRCPSRVDGFGAAEAVRPFTQGLGVGAAGPAGQCQDQCSAGLKRERDVLRGDPTRKIMLPRRETVDPGDDRVFVTTDTGDGKSAAPAVVDQRRHVGLDPRRGAALSREQQRTQPVVAIGKNIGFDRH
jgi:hypothetical protein